jgi:hypothetical protein
MSLLFLAAAKAGCNDEPVHTACVYDHGIVKTINERGLGFRPILVILEDISTVKAVRKWIWPILEPMTGTTRMLSTHQFQRVTDPSDMIRRGNDSRSTSTHDDH